MNRQCPTILAKRCELFAAFHFFELILFAAPFGDLKSMCIFFQFLKHKCSFYRICPLWWSSFILEIYETGSQIVAANEREP